MTHSVLVVDDDADFRNVLSHLLQRTGHEVITASGGEEAFDILQEKHLDLVISDIHMPRGNGLELLDRIRSATMSIPMVLMTTDISDIDAKDAHQRGVDALLGKPFDIGIFQQVMQGLFHPAQLTESVCDGLDIKLPTTTQGSAGNLQCKAMVMGNRGLFIALPEGHYPNVRDIVSFRIRDLVSRIVVEGSGVIRWVHPQESSGFPNGCSIDITYPGKEKRQQIFDYLDSRKFPIAG